MKSSNLLVPLTVTSLFAALTSPALNLVQNPGFETGDTSAWTYTEATADPFLRILPDISSPSYGIYIIDPHGGNFLAGFGAKGGDNDTLSQTLATVSGAEYDFSFWVNTLDGQSASYLDVSWGGNVVLQIDNTSSNSDWTNYNFIETATGPTTIAFAGRNAPSYVALDDVSVTRVPDGSPGLALIAATVVGLGGWRQLRRPRCATSGDLDRAPTPA